MSALIENINLLNRGIDMKGFIVVSPDNKYVIESDFSDLQLSDDINKAAVHKDDNVELPEGFKLMEVNVITTIIPHVELEIVEHVTKHDKTIRGVIRRDLTVEQAKAIDPYAFNKDGGIFIREKYLKAA